MDNTVVMTNEKKPSKIYCALDSFFHFTERNTTLKSEIGAGCSAFLVAICSFILNCYVVGEVYGNYAGSYLAVSLMAFLGTLLLGIFANRPLIQMSNLAIASTLVSMISAYNGLTYANMMMITFISSIIYLIIVLTPIGKKLLSLIPLSVKKTLPIAVGLFTMMEALKYSGLVSDSGLSHIGEFSMQGSYLLMMLIAIVVYVMFKILKVRKTAIHIFAALIGLMWAFGILFFSSEFIGGQTAATIVYQRVNVFFCTDGASPYNIALGFKSVDWFGCFKDGFNFTALIKNGGSPFFVIVKGVIIFLAMSLASNTAILQGSAAASQFIDKNHDVKESKIVHIISSASNVVAPMLGAPVQSIDTSSCILSDDEGKTGFSSIICSLGFFICMFTWFFFAIFATETHGVGMWIEQSEVKLASYVQDTFSFSCLIIALASSKMLVSVRDINFKDAKEVIPFIATIAGVICFKDIAFGMALGLISSFLCRLLTKEEIENKTGEILLSLASGIYLIFAIL